jgi:hypothetical protein
MFPGNYPIFVYRGDTYQWLFELHQDQHRRYPVNLTGAKAKAEIRDAPGRRLRAQMDCLIWRNRILVTLSAMQSDDLADTGVWDLQLTLISTVATIVRGEVTVMADVTDSRIVDAVDTAPLMLAAPALLPVRRLGSSFVRGRML